VALISIYVPVLCYILLSHYRNLYYTFSIISRGRNLLLGSYKEVVNSDKLSSDRFSSAEVMVL